MNPNGLFLRSAPPRYVIVDAIGVTKLLKSASSPLITKPSVPLKDLAPFNRLGGLGNMFHLFGAQTEPLIAELHEVLAA